MIISGIIPRIAIPYCVIQQFRPRKEILEKASEK
jgi:hypothetical protein